MAFTRAWRSGCLFNTLFALGRVSEREYDMRRIGIWDGDLGCGDEQRGMCFKGVFQFLHSRHHLSSNHLMTKPNTESDPSSIPCPFNLT
ncbi:hypothetical protein EYC84_008476 [Monilinia fructicola]|uniref:Uncharacterized protein n=1 Tax=Monilinia fructicola TaxID=38448 RepID=A0A5M9JEP9_MONFR|nr:hypothetical protein EYC84_008476 [Monilinia fructicola]